MANNKLTATDFNGDVLPETTNTYDLGSTSKVFTDIIGANHRSYGTSPTVFVEETDASSNAKVWRMTAAADILYLQTMDDAKTASDNIFRVSRSGNSVVKLFIDAPRYGGTDSHFESSQTTSPTTTLTNTTLNAGGTGASIVATGTDNVGNIVITAGNGAPTAGIAGQVVFNFAYAATPKCVILMPKDVDAIDLQPYISALSTTSFQISLNNAMAASEVAEWYYWVSG